MAIVPAGRPAPSLNSFFHASLPVLLSIAPMTPIVRSLIPGTLLLNALLKKYGSSERRSQRRDRSPTA